MYHEAAELPLPRATELIKQAERGSQHSAQLAIESAIEELDGRDARVNVGGVLSGSTVVPEDLSRILASHALIHAAEGVLFVHAIVSACETYGVKTISVHEREVWGRAATAWERSEQSLRKRIDDLRKSVGSPWNADHKTAGAIALLALKA